MKVHNRLNLCLSEATEHVQSRACTSIDDSHNTAKHRHCLGLLQPVQHRSTMYSFVVGGRIDETLGPSAEANRYQCLVRKKQRGTDTRHGFCNRRRHKYNYQNYPNFQPLWATCGRAQRLLLIIIHCEQHSEEPNVLDWRLTICVEHQ